MIKKLVYTVSILFICLGGVFGNTHAQCDACGQTPGRMQVYIDTMYQLLDFSVSGIPNESGVSIDRAERDQKTAEQDQRDVLAELPIDDEDGGNEILEGTKVRIRDYEKLKEIDGVIEKKLRELQAIERRGEVIPRIGDQAQVFNSILTQLGFVQFLRVNNEIALKDQTYKAYLGMLRRLNAMMKHLHRDMYWYHGSLADIGKGVVKSYTNDPEDTFSAGEKEKLKKVYIDLKFRIGRPHIESFTRSLTTGSTKLFVFTQDYRDLLLWIWSLQRDYECSVGVRNLCETRSQTAESSRNMVSKRRQNDGKRASKTFSDAWVRLKGALRFADDNSKAASQERQEQLMSQYRGDDFPQERKWREVARVNYEEEEVTYSPTSIQRLLKRVFQKRAKGDIKQNTKKDINNSIKNTGTAPSEEPQAATNDNPGAADTPSKRKAMLETHFYGYFDREEKEKRKNGQLDLRDYFTASTVDQEKRALYTSAMNVLEAQDSFDLNTLVYDVSEVTKQFPSLSYALYANANNRGDKGDPVTSEPVIYVAAQQVCTNQCTNIQDKQCGALGE